MACDPSPEVTTRCEGSDCETESECEEHTDCPPQRAFCQAGATANTCVPGCTGPEDCSPDAPLCLLEGSVGQCMAGCEEDTDCAGGECIDNTCVTCGMSASRLPTQSCSCSSDCAGSSAECNSGLCEADCQETGCPGDVECLGTPGVCTACDESIQRDEGGACECAAQCTGGLSCIAGLCLEPCDFDETCGDQECGHELATAPSCRPIDDGCVGPATGEAGDVCACNGDCGVASPFCLGFLVEGASGSVCSNVCSVEMPCATGFSCCGSGGQQYCLSDDLAEATGVECQ